MKSKQLKPKRVFYQTYMDLIDINELPKDQKETFRKWMNGQTQPCFTEFPKSNFAYNSDYVEWYRHWKDNKIAPIYD